MTDQTSTNEGGRYIQAALEVLHANAVGPFEGLPRTAGWGYPEPYTRDLMISCLGILVSGDPDLLARMRRVLTILAKNQSPLGQIPSLVHDPLDLGASDTTPLFLVALAFFRTVSHEAEFLDAAARKALQWLEFQRPDHTPLVGQLPTSDWRDEQWVLGYGLFVNVLVYQCYLSYGLEEQAASMRGVMLQPDQRIKTPGHANHEGFAIPEKPYFALWSYKVLHNERFDLLGNSLAILTGLADLGRAQAIIDWVEAACADLHHSGLLAVDLPPCLMPFIRPGDEDWHPRMEIYNQPGQYHNGGIWPFVCGFYIAALVRGGRLELARQKLFALDGLIEMSHDPALPFGFNEWHSAQDGIPRGQDWQTWSAAMYLYAAECVAKGYAPFFSKPA